MKSVLVICPRFLHDNPTSRQFERLILSIKEMFDITIITLPGPLERRKSCAKIVEVGAYTKRQAYIGEFIKHHFWGLATIPDEMRWSANALFLKMASLLIEERTSHFDFILTLSFPLSSHLVGEKLKQKYGIPLIALFYDPWIDNPYRTYPSGLFQKIDAKLERKVAESADACIFTNKVMSSIWKRRYKKCNVFTLPFCYSPQMMRHQMMTPEFHNNLVCMLYAGLSNEQRNLKDLILAVSELVQDDYRGISRLIIFITGNIYMGDKALADSRGLKAQVFFTGFLSYEKIKKLLAETDIFIVSDSPGRINVHTPSKLMDYFFYRRPILGITPLIGGTADELRASGNTVIENGDIGSIKQYLH